MLDHTRTAMGSRLIRQWIEKPLYNPLHIARRQQAVGAVCDDVIARTALTDALKRVFDMERLIGRVAYGTANCRDLRALSAAISCLPEIKTQAALFGQAMLRELTGKIDLLEDIRALVEQAIVDEPPILLREGGMIRKASTRRLTVCATFCVRRQGQNCRNRAGGTRAYRYQQAENRLQPRVRLLY